LGELHDAISVAKVALFAALAQDLPSVPPLVKTPAAAESPAGVVTPPLPVPAVAPTLVAPRDRSSFEMNVGMRWLLIAGVTIFVISVGLFLKYAFENNWIGPVFRVSLSYFVGFIFLGLGELFRRKKFDGFGLMLIGGGVAVMYASTYAAFALYHLVGQVPAFGVMVVVTAFAGVLSLVYDNKWLAVAGLLGGFLTPILLSTGSNNYHVLFAYSTILNLGVAWLALHKSWKLLNWLGFVATWLLYAGWHFRYYDDGLFWPAIIYLNIFFLIYAFVPYLYYFRHEQGARVSGFAISVLNSFIAFGFAYGMIEEHTELPAASLLSVLYAAVFLGMGRRLYPGNKRGFILSLAMALLFLAITVPVLFSGCWITIFWMAEAVIILWVALRLDSKYLCAAAIAMLAAVSGKLVCYDYAVLFGFNWLQFRFEPYYAALIMNRFSTVIVSLLALFAVARLLRRRRAVIANFTIIAFGLLLFFALNAEVAAFFAESMRGARAASISVLWALFSIALIVVGFAKNSTAARITAISLFGFTALKVLIVDMANVDAPFRIISCGVLGVLLIGASFLYYKYRDRLIAKNEGKPESHQ
jgi:uncharacterized membrane protein